MWNRTLIACWLIFSLFNSAEAVAAISGTTRVAAGLNQPTFATFAPGDPTHLFVLEKGGTIKVVDLNTKSVLPTAFLTVAGTLASNEGGLLGLAFDPDYNQTGATGFGKFYVYTTVANGGLPVPGGTAATATSPFSTDIREYSVSANPLVANTTAKEIISWPRPQDNHVAGWIGFNPTDKVNHYLYINSGDGGNGNDSGAGHFEPGGNAQTIINDFMGKQLRIDVSSDAFPADPNKNYSIPPTNPFVNQTGDDEIWSYGLRNPYRASFDRDTGDLWIGDVGQDTREEIDKQPANKTTVSNYGWRLREGNIQTPASGIGGAIPANYVAPVIDYTHGSGIGQGSAVIGGYVYRGPDPSLQGTYIFGDEVSSHYFSLDPSASTITKTNIESLLTPNVGTLSNPSSFAEDFVGNQYIISYGTGAIYRINTTQLLPGDYDQDGDVDADDYATWQKTFGATGTSPNFPPADGNHNGIVDEADYVIWRANLGSSVHTSGGASVAAVPESTTLVFFAELAIAMLVLPLFDRPRRLATIAA